MLPRQRHGPSQTDRTPQPQHPPRLSPPGLGPSSPVPGPSLPQTAASRNMRTKSTPRDSPSPQKRRRQRRRTVPPWPSPPSSTTSPAPPGRRRSRRAGGRGGGPSSRGGPAPAAPRGPWPAGPASRCRTTGACARAQGRTRWRGDERRRGRRSARAGKANVSVRGCVRLGGVGGPRRGHCCATGWRVRDGAGRVQEVPSELPHRRSPASVEEDEGLSACVGESARGTRGAMQP